MSFTHYDQQTARAELQKKLALTGDDKLQAFRAVLTDIEVQFRDLPGADTSLDGRISFYDQTPRNPLEKKFQSS